MEVDFRQSSEISLKDCEPKKNERRLFDKTWDQYVYTVFILVMAFTYVNQTLEEYLYFNYSDYHLDLLFECLLSSIG